MTAEGSFPPDTPLVDAVLPSPNHGERVGGPADMLLLHYTGMPTGAEAIARLRDPLAEVSCHYVVEEDGRVLQLVPEHRRAWQAGAGFWAGERDINSRSIGIEIVNAGHAGGLPAFPAAQIASTVALCRDILRRLAIPPRRVLAHSDVAPTRKEDPGERFPWADLAAAGIGLWVGPVAATPGTEAMRPGDDGHEIRLLQERFARFGYEIAASGRFDDGTRAVVAAFQRRFRPERVDGVADGATVATLAALLDRLP